jgi:hypothetical protein
MLGGHHRAERGDEAALRVREKGRDPRKRLLLLGVEDVEDRGDKKRMRGLLPMVAPLERAFRIDQDVGDVLDVADFLGAAADLEQRIVARRPAAARASAWSFRRS